MADDVILNKTQMIERCIQRVREEYQDNPDNLLNYTKQDSIILNIQRACEASIDLAMHTIAIKGFGLPQSSKDSFDILKDNSIIEPNLAEKLKSMVGFRNIAVHNYQSLQLDIIKEIINSRLADLTLFGQVLLKQF